MINLILPNVICNLTPNRGASVCIDELITHIFITQIKRRLSSLLYSKSNFPPSATTLPKPIPIRKMNEITEKLNETKLGIDAKKTEDFSSWYTQVLLRSDMMDYYDVSGCYILKPWSFFIWKCIQGVT
jgi:hypothetical protein